MKHAFRLTEVAEQDLSEAARYIAQDSRDGAERFLAAFEETCDLLAGMPEAGSALQTIVAALRDIRMLRVERFTKYLIFYRPRHREGIEIIRVIHAARDYRAFFEE
jgi:toxin ParE1/3/4